MKHCFIFVFLLSQAVFAAEPFRTIAILENERSLQSDSGTHLADYFQSKSVELRARAVLAAARIGDPAILPRLEKVSGDNSSQVRQMVAFALGQIRSKKGLPAAITMLKDSDPEVLRLAIEAIGRIGGVDATSFVAPFLSSKSLAIREQAALALALIKDKATVDSLIRLAQQDDAAQWSYVYALYRLADERAVSVLHAVLASPVPSPSTGDPSSLLFALKALWAMKKSLSHQETEMLLKNPDARVVQNTLDVIAASVDKTACATVHDLYGSMNSITKGKTLETLGVLGCMNEERPDSPVLLGVWGAAQAKSQKEKALPLLQELAKHTSWVVRWRIAQALANLPAESAIPLLKVLMNDPDSAVRLASMDSLSEFLPETAALFVPLLDSKDFAVRATAVDALGKTKNPKYLPGLINTYNASQDPSEIEGRVALLDVLPDFNNSDALKVYERALIDPEYTIRRHAIDGIKKLIGSGPYYFHGELKDPESFLYQADGVSLKTMNEYPANYGEALKPVEVTMKLDRGDVVIRLFTADAPLHVENFLRLAARGFYNGLRIHRVVPNFVIQGGDPRGDGWGGAGNVIHDQVNLRVYKRGMVGMPIAGKDTGGSQFFITQSRQPHLDGNYTIFGEVIAGMEVVDETEIGDRILSVEIRN